MEEIQNNKNKDEILHYEYTTRGPVNSSYFFFGFFTFAVISIIIITNFLIDLGKFDWTDLNNVLWYVIPWILLIIPITLYPRQKNLISISGSQLYLKEKTFLRLFNTEITLDLSDMGVINYSKNLNHLEIRTKDHKLYFSLSGLFNQTRYLLDLFGLTNENIDAILLFFKQSGVDIREI